MKAPWRLRFLKVVERTLFELNLEFTSYSIGQAANGESKKSFFDPTIQGLEFADELTVTSAIVNDLLSSTFINGDLDDDRKGELKFYKVNREVPYPEDPLKRVDLTIQRINSETIIKNSGGKLKSYQLAKSKVKHKVSFIEAKRAKRYSNKLLSKKLIEGIPTYHELKKNIEERLLKKKRGFKYILVWGLWNSQSEKENTPSAYLRNLQTGKNFTIETTIRWIPLSWDIPQNMEGVPKGLTIKKWCWILLGQIEKDKSVSPQ